MLTVSTVSFSPPEVIWQNYSDQKRSKPYKGLVLIVYLLQLAGLSTELF